MGTRERIAKEIHAVQGESAKLRECPFLYREVGCSDPEKYKDTGELNPQNGVTLRCEPACHKRVMAILSPSGVEEK